MTIGHQNIFLAKLFIFISQNLLQKTRCSIIWMIRACVRVRHEHNVIMSVCLPLAFDFLSWLFNKIISFWTYFRWFIVHMVSKTQQVYNFYSHKFKIPVHVNWTAERKKLINSSTCVLLTCRKDSNGFAKLHSDSMEFPNFEEKFQDIQILWCEMKFLRIVKPNLFLFHSINHFTKF